jgi:hypothetical protein
MRQAGNGAGGSFCLVESIVVPPGFRVEAKCEGIARGRFGYALELAP